MNDSGWCDHKNRSSAGNVDWCRTCGAIRYGAGATDAPAPGVWFWPSRSAALDARTRAAPLEGASTAEVAAELAPWPAGLERGRAPSCNDAACVVQRFELGARASEAEARAELAGVQLRRAVGVAQDVQRLDGEVRAVLEAYAGVSPPVAKARRCGHRVPDLAGGPALACRFPPMHRGPCLP